MTTTLDDWHAVHQKVVDAFAAVWDDINSHSFDPFMADDVRLVQPLMPACTGKQQWWDEVDRLQKVVTDLRSDVLSWSGTGSVLFIEHRLSATVGRRRVSVVAIDKFRVTDTGIVTSRIAHFDPAPMMRAVLLSPSTWLPWWRSGLAPMLGRRKILAERKAQ